MPGSGKRDPKSTVTLASALDVVSGASCIVALANSFTGVGLDISAVGTVAAVGANLGHGDVGLSSCPRRRGERRRRRGRTLGARCWPSVCCRISDIMRRNRKTHLGGLRDASLRTVGPPSICLDLAGEQQSGWWWFCIIAGVAIGLGMRFYNMSKAKN